MPNPIDPDKKEDLEIKIKKEHEIKPEDIILGRIPSPQEEEEDEEDQNQDQQGQREEDQEEGIEEKEKDQGEKEEKEGDKDYGQKEDNKEPEGSDEQEPVESGPSQLDEELQEQGRQNELDRLNQEERLAKKIGERGAGQAAVGEAGGAAVAGGEAAAAAGAGAVGGGATAGAAAVGGAGLFSSIGAFLVSTAPVWIPIFLIGVLMIFLVVLLVSACDQSGIKGYLVRGGGSWAAAIVKALPSDLCKQLSFQGGSSGGGGGGGGFPFDIVITSAYRPNQSGSAHQRGEAIDFSLRPRPTDNNDYRIDQLVAIAKDSFPGPFAGAKGDTLDEYRKPTENATGGHVHVEFNTYSSNGKTYTYCDNTEVIIPPIDLEDISDFPVEGITAPNSAKVRPCMVDEVLRILNAASSEG